jgi:hypothetical protein
MTDRYRQKREAALDAAIRAGLIRRGELYRTTVEHDHCCALLTVQRPCKCDPDIAMEPIAPPDTPWGTPELNGFQDSALRFNKLRGKPSKRLKLCVIWVLTNATRNPDVDHGRRRCARHQPHDAVANDPERFVSGVARSRPWPPEGGSDSDHAGRCSCCAQRVEKPRKENRMSG